MKHTYNGNHTREFPSLGLTLNPSDTFEAPEDFNAHKAFEDVKPAKKAQPKGDE